MTAPVGRRLRAGVVGSGCTGVPLFVPPQHRKVGCGVVLF